MSEVTVWTSLVDKLNTLAAGYFEKNQGRTENLPWKSNTNIRPLWNVNIGGVQLASGVKQSIGIGSNRCFEYRYTIKGFFPHNYKAKSDETWYGYVKAVMDLLSVQPALDNCEHTFPPRLVENDFAMYVDVLCHYALIEFVVQEWR